VRQRAVLCAQSLAYALESDEKRNATQRWCLPLLVFRKMAYEHGDPT
jgi:hypothetical protein